MSNKYGPRIVTDGLVLCLDAADTNSYPRTGTVWYDISGNGYNGSLINGPTFDSNNAGGIDFDSTDDYVQLSEVSAFQTNKFTIEMFLKTEQALDSSKFFGFFSTITSLNAGFQLFWRGSSYQYFYLFVGDIVVTSSSGSIPSGTFLHLAATYDAGNVNNVALYVNKTRYSGTGLGTYATSNLPPRIIGRRADSTTNYHLDCKLYTTRFYNRPLSESEVLQNYNATKGRFGL